jgi:hypothetical protein
MFNQICLQEIDLNMIELDGGGSAGCILAEVFLPKK